MKHAILIIAYHNIEYVKSLIEKFDEDFYVFIHWDKKFSLTDEQKKSLTEAGNVKCIAQEYSVNWASYGIVRTTLFLCEEATRYKDVDYVHLISDGDALSTDLDTFKDFFHTNNGKNYLENIQFPVKPWKQGGWNRVKLNHRLEHYNIKNKKECILYEKEIEEQIQNSQVRQLPAEPLYGGSAWWSLTRECTEYLLSKKSFIEENFVDTMFPDEMFAQTTIMNSKYADSVVNHNLRYISWGWRNGNNPAILDRTDFPLIVEREKFFARKIDPEVSKELLLLIESIYFSGIQIENTDAVTSLKLIVEYLKINCIPNLKGGLCFGNIGALILFAHCNTLQKNDNLVCDSDIEQLLSYVKNEFLTTSDRSYESGFLGLTIGLEYLYGLLGKDYFDEEVIDKLDEINSASLNYITNFYNPDSDSQFYIFRIYNSYFKTREYANRITTMDRAIWDKILQKNREREDENQENLYSKISNHGPVGLNGYSGNGLRLLSELYGLKMDEWTFLIV